MQEEREIKKQLQRKAINNLFSNDYVYMPQQSKLLDKKCLEIALDERDELERFTRLVIDKRVAMDLITNKEDVKDFIKYNSHCDKYDFIVPLTEEEFNFIREMIEKYEQKTIQKA